jgi:hypothetical protein
MDDPEQFERIDSKWIDGCLYRFDEEDGGFSQTVFQPDEYVSRNDIVVFLGEADKLQPEMVELSSTPMPQRPKESHIFKMSRRASGKLRWHFMGRWTPLLPESNIADVATAERPYTTYLSMARTDSLASLDSRGLHRRSFELRNTNVYYEDNDVHDDGIDVDDEQNRPTTSNLPRSQDDQTSNRHAVEDEEAEYPRKKPRSASPVHSFDGNGEKLAVYDEQDRPSALSTTTEYRTAAS